MNSHNESFVVRRSSGEPFDYLKHRMPGPGDCQHLDGLINAGLGGKKGSAISDREGALVCNGRLSFFVSSLAPANSSGMLGLGDVRPVRISRVFCLLCQVTLSG